MLMFCLLCHARVSSDIPLCQGGACSVELNLVLQSLLPVNRASSFILARHLQTFVTEPDAAVLVALGGGHRVLDFLRGAFQILADRLGDKQAKALILDRAEAMPK